MGNSHAFVSKPTAPHLGKKFLPIGIGTAYEPMQSGPNEEELVNSSRTNIAHERNHPRPKEAHRSFLNDPALEGEKGAVA